jgi:hypothetical protein
VVQEAAAKGFGGGATSQAHREFKEKMEVGKYV